MAKRGNRLPEAVLADMRRQLGGGWVPGITVLSGDDLFHLDLAQKDLLAALVPPGESEYALTVFGDRRVHVTTVIGAARSQGMFAPCRVVLLRDLGMLEGDATDAKTIQGYASDPPPRSYLLVRAPTLDRRRELHKSLVRDATVLTFQLPDRPDWKRIATQVSALARDRGLRLDREATALLVQAYGSDLYRIASELEKLRNWLGGAREPVTGDVVRRVASSGGVLSGWEVADEIEAGDRSGALAAARRLMDRGEEPIRVVGGLAWRLRRLLLGKAMLEGGASRTAVLGTLRIWPRESQKPFLEATTMYSLDELLRCPANLLRADRTLKSRSLDRRAVLEDLVDRLIVPARPAGTSEDLP